MHGRAIRIFLVDGTPNALRTVEVGLSTIKAVIAPRMSIDALKLRGESARTGVYILIGDDSDNPGRLAIYIGEGDSVLTRILNHDVAKDFWHTVVLFVSKDENLTKAHVRWIEARLIEQGLSARRAKIHNIKEETGGNLPEADAAEMSEFIDQIRLILASVGFDVFAPLPAVISTSIDTTPESPTFYMGKDDLGYKATARVQGDLLVVTKGSIARKEEAATLQAIYKTLRAALLSDGVLVDKGAHLEFAQDYGFNSPTQASGVVGGSTFSGRKIWAMKDGTTYEAWEAKNAEDAGKAKTADAETSA
ncbi:GIY-YIG nuclease family protein [Sorangium sp. So ce1099]|uniref:GIY-YIG nuclease family protein n=1 Tax=Sorangium sp. So ce1099 TaxID=3133331 RepID=UPI003F6026A8